MRNKSKAAVAGLAISATVLASVLPATIAFGAGIFSGGLNKPEAQEPAEPAPSAFSGLFGSAQAGSQEQPAPAADPAPAPAPAAPAAPESLYTPPTVQLSDTIRATVSVDGHVVQLPFFAWDLQPAGWFVVEEDAAHILSDGMSMLSKLTPDGAPTYDYYQFASLYNLSGAPRAASDCMVSDLTIKVANIRPGQEVLFAGGIGVDSSIEDVIAAYGEPSRSSESDGYTYLRYSDIPGAFPSEQVTFTFKDGVMYEVDLYMYASDCVWPEGLPTSDSATAALAAMGTAVEPTVMPTKVSDDFWDYTFSLNGSVVKTPCMVSDLLALGFVMDESMAGGVLDNNSRTSLKLYLGDPKEDSYIYLSVYNTSGSLVPIEQAMVEDVMANAYSDKVVPVVLSQGITYGSTFEDIVSAFGREPDQVNEGDGYVAFTYYREPGEFTRYSYGFTVDTDEGLISIDILRDAE